MQELKKQARTLVDIILVVSIIALGLVVLPLVTAKERQDVETKADANRRFDSPNAEFNSAAKQELTNVLKAYRELSRKHEQLVSDLQAVYDMTLSHTDKKAALIDKWNFYQGALFTALERAKN